MADWTYPPRIELAQQPTPLQRLDRLSHRYGKEVLCKRDDLTGSVLSGNKVRKLEFLVADAIDNGCSGLVTCGGEQSNHARATALVAAQLGMRCQLLLHTADPSRPPQAEANIFLGRLCGATLQWISADQYAQRDALMAQAAARLAEQEDSYYVIPEGGSNALGAWGYVRCAVELAQQVGHRPAAVVCAAGSGGTAAGLIAGFKLLGLPYRLIGICVCHDAPTFQQRISAILQAMHDTYGIEVETAPEDIEIWDDYVGLGYALCRDEELQTIVELARGHGLVLDPVYTGKAMHGLLTELDKQRPIRGPIVFVHTGGVFGLFPKAAQLRPLL